jgi:site-specific DNA recombinase
MNTTDAEARRARIVATRTAGARTETGTATIYTRISQDKRGQGAGSERQLQDCRELCAARGWTIVGEFDDPNITATKGKVRPAFEALLASDPERVVVWDVDRLLRSPKELERIIDLGLQVHAVTQSSIGLDLESVNGRAMARIAVAMAAQEGEHKAERVARQAEDRAAEGRPKWGRRPFGYNRDATICEAEAQHVREAYGLIIGGSSVSSVARDWNGLGLTTTGGKPWSAVMVSELLRSARNAGILVFRGAEIGPGTWDGIVTETTYRAAMRVFATPGRRHGGDGKRKYLLTGVALCGVCDGPVTGGTKGKGTEPHYRCSNSDHFRVPVEYIDGLMFRWLPLILTDEKARKFWRRKVEVSTERGDVLDAERVEIEERLLTLAADHGAGLIDRAQLLAASERGRGRLAEIDAELGALDAAANADASWWLDAELVWQELDAMGTDAMRELIRNVCTDVRIHQRGRGRPGLRMDLLTVESIGGKSYPPKARGSK